MLRGAISGGDERVDFDAAMAALRQALRVGDDHRRLAQPRRVRKNVLRVEGRQFGQLSVSAFPQPAAGVRAQAEAEFVVVELALDGEVRQVSNIAHHPAELVFSVVADGRFDGGPSAHTGELQAVDRDEIS